ncbi:hypothetical protein [Sandaracinus amylolyticus]|uniref:hypothetical protein n=1 Tax=Sandaracinus amylolyticus TaxID=927083 RepID=UPI001F386F50|nr:hypothetical protein [Sandaracinus amylolyticus]UJR83944.1 Hypothetical protein I5071_60150 [Sandaracinus amylolyticus]
MAIDADIESALARVSWSSLQHCRGSAEDVPALTRAMLSAPRASERTEARRALAERIQHQGSIVEATPQVAPILARALRVAPPDDRGHLVAMIAQLAYATTMTEGSGALLWASDAERPKLEAQHRRELAWVRATRRATWSARDALLELLDVEGDEALLVNVPSALVALIDAAGDDAPEGTDLDATARDFALAIAARARKPATEKAHAGFASALGHLAKRVPELLPALRAALDRAPWPARVASAIGVLRVSPHDERATDVLIEALRRRAEHDAWFPHPFPWRSGHFRFFLIAVLAGDRVSDAGFERALPVLVDVARRDTSQSTFEQDALRPLERALEGTVITPRTRRADLPRAALALLDALYDNPEMWSRKLGDVDVALRPLGLANDVASWRVLLERA